MFDFIKRRKKRLNNILALALELVFASVVLPKISEAQIIIIMLPALGSESEFRGGGDYDIFPHIIGSVINSYSEQALWQCNYNLCLSFSFAVVLSTVKNVYNVVDR